MKNWYYVTIYLKDLAYGGSEEGGWTFTTYEPINCEENRAFVNKGNAKRYHEGLCDIIEEWNKGRRDIDSVLSEGIYVVLMENHLPCYKPAKRPTYS